MITDRTRFSVIQMNTNQILSTDLIVKEPQVTAQLSAPAVVNFKVSYGEAAPGHSADGITWKTWGLWIITEMCVDGVYKIVACTIVTDAKVDPTSFDMVIESKGFSFYPKGIPWLENWNDIAVDPFEIVQRIYSHLQATSSANLGIEVLPASSGTIMLPGYGFDGAILVFDFFALFVRAIDFSDSGDYITGLSRDIPFDYIEECEWNVGPGPNMLTNPNFVANILGWSGTDATWDGAQGKIAPGSIRFAGNATAKGVVGTQIPVQTGDKIDISTWIRTSGYTTTGATDPVYVYLEAFDAAHAHVSYPVTGYPIAPATVGSLIWEKLTAPRYVVPEGVKYVSIGLTVRESALTGVIWFDDLVLTKEVQLRTEVLKTFRMSYPSRGVQQAHLSFRLGENVMQLELAEEKDIEWVSDVIIRGWFPGKVYSSRLSNADPTRARRTVLEEDAKIDSTERAAAWAKRKLTRRTVPKYWTKAIINPNDDNGQFGAWELGDLIFVEGEYPWCGQIAEWHKIMSWTYDEASGQMELGLKVEGAFNYDPIDYDPNPGGSPIVDHNLLTNGYFQSNMAGWRSDRGAWFRVANVGYDTPGSARIDCDDAGEKLTSHKIAVTPGVHMTIQGAVRWQSLELTGAGGNNFDLVVLQYMNGGFVGEEVMEGTANPASNHTWVPLLENNWIVPTGINEIAIQLRVNPVVLDGVAFWDDIKVLVNV